MFLYKKKGKDIISCTNMKHNILKSKYCESPERRERGALPKKKCKNVPRDPCEQRLLLGEDDKFI